MDDLFCPLNDIAEALSIFKPRDRWQLLTMSDPSGSWSKFWRTRYDAETNLFVEEFCTFGVWKVAQVCIVKDQNEAILKAAELLRDRLEKEDHDRERAEEESRNPDKEDGYRLEGADLEALKKAMNEAPF